MADEEKTEEVKEPKYSRSVLVDWHGASEGVSIGHANQVTVQVHEREMILSFFMFCPPVLLGTTEEVLVQAESITKLEPECVGRISVAPHTFEALIGIMQGKLDEYKAEMGKESK